MLGGAHRPVFSHLSLLLLSGETQEPGHLLLPRCHQEQQRQRPAESHESRLRVLLVDGWTGGGTGGASTEQSVSAERLHGDCLLSVGLSGCFWPSSIILLWSRQASCDGDVVPAVDICSRGRQHRRKHCSCGSVSCRCCDV